MVCPNIGCRDGGTSRGRAGRGEKPGFEADRRPNRGAAMRVGANVIRPGGSAAPGWLVEVLRPRPAEPNPRGPG